MKLEPIFEELITGKNLSTHQMQEIIYACMSGELHETQLAVFLALMRMKGETTEELIAAAQVMQRCAHYIDLGTDLVDIVGTGGDKKNTFNVSTASSFVVAGAGIKVAKHGNRSVSSRSGSADLLQQAGFVLQLSDEEALECIKQCRCAFLFAPNYHPALHYAQAARQHLGIRTLFNLLGPIINPARVKRQVLGVYTPQWQKPLAKVLASLGSERALVISAQDGLDEVSIAAPTDVIEYHQGKYNHWVIDPNQYGLKHPTLDEIIVDSSKQSLRLIQSVLEGEQNPARDIVILNAAAAIYCAKNNLSFEEAIELAKQSLNSQRALQCFQKLRALTETFIGQRHE